MQNEIQTIEQLSHQVGEIIFGTFFSLVGLAAGFVAVIRRGKGVRILIGLALWSGLFGTRLLIQASAVTVQFPQSFQLYIPYMHVAMTYLILVSALLTCLDLTRGLMHTCVLILMFVAMAISLAGFGWFVFTGFADTFMLYNNLLAAGTLITILIIIMSRKLSEKFLVLPNKGVLAIGWLLFTAEALYTNLSNFFGYKTWQIHGWLGFAALLFALVFVAAKMIFASERRLVAIESELQTARMIQSFILPVKVPELNGLSVAAAYYPMTEVAGDYYDFIEIDQHQAGFLVADVSGHGVPAALIASMIKVAMESVRASAEDPGEVLRLLGNILGKQLHGQHITAAYLYVNSETCQARYSAAGHPPLLYWDSASKKVQFVESNGLLFGVVRETWYPVRELAFKRNDRFLLYTDGLTEAKNSTGEAFDNHRLSEVLRLNENVSAEALGQRIFEGLKSWQFAKTPQQDDITWVIVDIK